MAKTQAPAEAVVETPTAAVAPAPEAVPATEGAPFAAELAQAEAAGVKDAQVVYSGTKGASPALRVDY